MMSSQADYDRQSQLFITRCCSQNDVFVHRDKQETTDRRRRPCDKSVHHQYQKVGSKRTTLFLGQCALWMLILALASVVDVSKSFSSPPLFDSRKVKSSTSSLHVVEPRERCVLQTNSLLPSPEEVAMLSPGRENNGHDVVTKQQGEDDVDRKIFHPTPEGSKSAADLEQKTVTNQTPESPGQSTNELRPKPITTTNDIIRTERKYFRPTLNNAGNVAGAIPDDGPKQERKYFRPNNCGSPGQDNLQTVPRKYYRPTPKAVDGIAKQSKNDKVSANSAKKTKGPSDKNKPSFSRNNFSAANRKSNKSRSVGGNSQPKALTANPVGVPSAIQTPAGGQSLSKLASTAHQDASSNSTSANVLKTSKSSKKGSPAKTPMTTEEAIQKTVDEMFRASPSMGILGEPSKSDSDDSEQMPAPGTVLVTPCQHTSRWSPAERVSVRVAERADDLDIANLRLSVFANFSPEMRDSFCSKSCHVLATRRERGAMCIVATVPRYGSLVTAMTDIILGTAECSFHEFTGTTLGERRPPDSVAYLTEVAVSPTARRKGIGSKIMKAIDELASIRGIETLYLHVDVNNTAAISLYERSGYCQVPSGNPIYEEFTKSLNLHDGATKGRNHFLYQKDVTRPTWLPEPEKSSEGTERASLGIEVPS